MAIAAAGNKVIHSHTHLLTLPIYSQHCSSQADGSQCTEGGGRSGPELEQPWYMA